MTAQLNQILARQRSADLQRVGVQEPRAAGFTLRGHHLAKLDRFVGQAQRAAVRAHREFEGVTVEVNAEGVVTVHAVGLTPILL